MNISPPGWFNLEPAVISHFLPQSSQYHPQTVLRLAHDGRALHGLFEVQDRFVRCTRTGYGSEVWKDSCVEFFIEPKPGRGYCNFEFNCGGAFLVNHIIDPTRTAEGFKEFTRIPEVVARQVEVRASLPPVVEPEITTLLTWTLGFKIPFACWNNTSVRSGRFLVRPGVETFSSARKKIPSRIGRRGRPWMNSTFTGRTVLGNCGCCEKKPAARLLRQPGKSAGGRTMTSSRLSARVPIQNPPSDRHRH